MLTRIVNSILFTFLLLSQGYATESWSPPDFISDKVDDSASYVALDSEGNAVAVFVCMKGNNRWIEAAVKPVNGSWSKPVALTQKTNVCYCRAIFPRVSINDEGTAIAVWNFPDGDNEVIQSATLPAGSSQWIPGDKPLATNMERMAGPYLQMDKNGVALAAWGSLRDGQYYFESARFSKTSPDWFPNAPLEIPYTFTGTNLHVNASGEAWLIWSKGGFLSGENVAVSNLPAYSVNWSTPATIVEQSGITYNAPQIVSDVQGNVLATWQEYDLTNLVFTAYQRPKGQDWQKTNLQNVETHIYSRGWLTLDPAGNALFMWLPDDHILMNSQLAVGTSTWTPPALVSSECIFYYRGSVDSQGNRLLSYINNEEEILKTITLPVSGTDWTAPVSIAPASGSLEDCQFSTDGSAMILYSNPWGTLQSVTGVPF